MNQPQSTYPATVDAFKQVVEDFKASAGYKEPLLFAVGSRVFTGNGTLASVRYPVVNGPGQNTASAAIWMKVLGVTPTGVQNITVSAAQLTEILAYFAPFKN
ncbi:tetrahydrodipicolinate N-succinyltransferase N-terminal domain-containing protein, partial [Acinetobacter baumannii]